MSFSARTQYACLAALELARQYGLSQPLPLRRIADQHRIPTPFLVQILLQLKGAGIVESMRGSAGGYRLARDPDQITLWDIVTVTEVGGSAPVLNETQASRVLQAAWRKASEAQRDYLAGVTLAKLLEQMPHHADSMYYI